MSLTAAAYASEPGGDLTPDRRVLFVLGGRDMRGGAEISMLRLARGLREKGHHVSVAVYGTCSAIADHAGPHVEIIPVKAERAVAAFIPLSRLIRARRPDIIISALTHTNIITLLAARLASTGARVIVTEHGQTGFDPRFLKMRDRLIMLPKLAGVLYAWADEVIAVSKGLAVFLQRFVSGRPVRVIYNPVASSWPSSVPHPWLEEKAVPVILGVGRLEKEKNFALLIRAFAIVAKSRPVRLVILGEGSQRAGLEALAQNLGIRECVLLPGFMQNVSGWMRRAAVFVSPSIIEAFGNAIVEAIACGLSVVATDCPYGPSEILEQGRYGRLVPVSDTESMAAAIQDILDHPLEKGLLTARATLFNEKRCFEAYDELIRALCAEARRSAA